jgi:hypothetical protein
LSGDTVPLPLLEGDQARQINTIQGCVAYDLNAAMSNGLHGILGTSASFTGIYVDSGEGGEELYNGGVYNRTATTFSRHVDDGAGMYDPTSHSINFSSSLSNFGLEYFRQL